MPRKPLVVIAAGLLATAGATVLSTVGAQEPDELDAFAGIPYLLSYSTNQTPQVTRIALDPAEFPRRSPVHRFASDGSPGPNPGEVAWIGFPTGPDDRTIPGELFYRDAEDAEPVQLTDGGFHHANPAISPDGTRIAFESDRGGSTDIWLINVDGTGLSQLTADPVGATWPAWSPDGSELAYAGFGDDPEGDIYRIPAGGGVPTRLTDTPGADIEPVWHPITGEITFTTTRFRPDGDLTDVVVMPADGGPVTRILPAEWDSRHGAWSPDGALFAFATFRFDVHGDVYLLVDGEVEPLSARGNHPETHPRLDAAAVYLTEDGRFASQANIWTSQPDGTGRVNLTRRPGTAETEPAWSLDGSRLAQVIAPADSGTRIVVADPDGQNLRLIAPPGTLPDHDDSSPTWSPDGTMLAFTRTTPGTGSRPTILIVDVETSQLLGEIPKPAGLSTNDHRPAWSPDGTRLAFQRSISLAPPYADPPTVDTPGNPGDEIDIDVSVAVPKLPSPMDVVFLVDASRGMESTHEVLKEEIDDVVDAVRAEAGGGVRVGLATYTKESQEDTFQVHQGLSVLSPSFSMQRVEILDVPFVTAQDDWIYALHQLATGTPDEPEGNRIEFRADATKVIVLIGDAPSQEPSLGHRLTTPGGDPGDTLQALTAAGIRVIGISVGNGGTPFSGGGLDGNTPGEGQASLVAEATGGVYDELFVGPGQLVDAVLERGFRRLPVTVTPLVDCDTGLAVAADPAARTVTGGQDAEFTLTVAVAADAPPGAPLRCLVTYLLGTGENLTQEITVRVGDGVTPQVRVDDVSVATTDPTGAIVDYLATATGPGGDPLTPSCTPPSGTRFPVGMTTVTCTATAGAATGTDTATITVYSEEAGTDIWLADLTIPAPDTVRVTGQTDLSILVGRNCGEGGASTTDFAPAWSPGAVRLVYAVFASNTPCIIDADGSNPRRPFPFVPGSFFTAIDPAWSPDGQLIAFAQFPGEGPTSQIMTVPAAGGEPTVVIGSTDFVSLDVSHPTFRPLEGPPTPPPSPTPTATPPPGTVGLSALAVTVGTFPLPGFVGGDDLLVTYTVRNTSDTTLSTSLAPDLPTELPVADVDDRCASASVCDLGILPPGGAATRTFTLTPTQAVVSTASGVATGVPLVDGLPATAQGAAPVEVLAPELILSPPIGPPGFVTLALGTDFPPGATVRLTWRDPDELDSERPSSIPLTASSNTVLVNPDGTLSWQALVFRSDVLGPRVLVAQWEDGPTGTAFGPVTAEFLVVPRTLQPPLYEGRG